MTELRGAFLTLTLLGALALPAPWLPAGAAPLRAQACDAAGARVGLEAGAVRYRLAAGVSGGEVGLDGAFQAGATAVGMGYRRLSLGDRGPAPHVVRASARRPLVDVRRIALCAVAHAGLSTFAAGDDRATVGAAGAGLMMVPAGPAGAPVLPFLEVRGLAALSGGRVQDVGVGASGLGLGVEGGATIAVRRILVRASVSADGLAAGLGVTPYPALAWRLGAGYRF